MLRWFQDHSQLVDKIFLVSICMFVASLLLVPTIVARLPSDYFAEAEAPEPAWNTAHPIARLALLIARNMLGGVLVLAGMLMLFLPGQGLITIALGLGLMCFPGKRELELAVVRRAPVLRALNWLRHKAGREPLRVYRSPPEP